MGRKGVQVKKKILFITDMNFTGSGYLNISVSLLEEMSKVYDVAVVGFGYEGQENWWPFSVIPCKDLGDLYSIVHNLNVISQTSPDVIIVAIDIPQQIIFHKQFKQYGKPYIAITPLENPPLTLTWAARLMEMDHVFFISELGKEAGEKAGLSNVGHIEIGIDTNKWRLRTPDENKSFKKGMGIEEDETVILTVAENQERKNLSAALAIICELKRKGHKIRYILVTRVESQYGWNLRDLSLVLGVNKEVMLMNKGMPHEQLWSLYAMADLFLLTSKAEGLGLPIMESMSVGVPCFGTDTGAIRELLTDGRGFLLPYIYSFVDVWGNSKRDMVDIEKSAEMISDLIGDDAVWKEKSGAVCKSAREYVEGRTWSFAAKQLEDKIEEVTNVEKK